MLTSLLLIVSRYYQGQSYGGLRGDGGKWMLFLCLWVYEDLL